MKTLLLVGLFSIVVTGVTAAPKIPDWVRSAAAIAPGEWSRKPAVILYDSQTARFITTDQVTDTYRTAVRPNTLAGRRHAAVHVSYNPNTERIKKLTAWIVSADGKKTSELGRDKFLDIPSKVSGTEWSNQRSILLDGSSLVDVGGVFAWEIEMESSSPITAVSRDFAPAHPVEYTALEVIPPPNGRLLWHATGRKEDYAPTPGSTPGSLVWSRRHVEPWIAPEVAGYTHKSAWVMVRCERPAGAEMDLSSWQSLSAAIVPVLKPQLQPEGPVGAKAQELVAGKSSRWDRIGVLCRFAQQEIRYLSIAIGKDYLIGYRPHPAADVLKNRYGDCKDKATLLISMLEAIGEKGYFVLVSSGDPLAIPEQWPSLTFNHVIVGFPAGDEVPPHWPIVDGGALGRLVVFDPTNTTAPLGVLASEDQGGFGLIVSEPGTGLVRMPLESADHVGTVRTIQAVLSARGHLTAELDEFRFGSDGSESYARRMNLRDDGFGRFVEARLHRMFASLSAFKWKDTWDPASARHQLNCRFEIPNYARRLGRDRLLITPRVLAPYFRLSPPGTNLEGALFHAARTHDTVRTKIPAGCALEEIPENVRFEHEMASCEVSYREEAGDLVCELRYLNKGGYANRAQYESLRVFMQRMQDAVRRPAIVKLSREVVAATVGLAPGTPPPDAASAVAPASLTNPPDKPAAATAATAVPAPASAEAGTSHAPQP